MRFFNRISKEYIVIILFRIVIRVVMLNVQKSPQRAGMLQILHCLHKALNRLYRTPRVHGVGNIDGST